MTLGEIRARIDALDTELLELLNKRADLVHEVGLLKKREPFLLIRFASRLKDE